MTKPAVLREFQTLDMISCKLPTGKDLYYSVSFCFIPRFSCCGYHFFTITVPLGEGWQCPSLGINILLDVELFRSLLAVNLLCQAG